MNAWLWALICWLIFLLGFVVGAWWVGKLVDEYRSIVCKLVGQLRTLGVDPVAEDEP
jgi:hypothetical protein